MLLPPWSAFVIALSLQTPETPRDPCRRSHCTLLQDLPAILAQTDPLDPDSLRVSTRGPLDVLPALHHLMDRHRHGHGARPDPRSTATFAALGLASCDPTALDALGAVVFTSIERGYSAINLLDISRWFELNARFAEAEAMLLARITPGSAPPDDYDWRYYGEFLARRGRFEEALPILESYREASGGCGLGDAIRAHDRFEWIKLCFDALHPVDCAGILFEKRWRTIGIHGLSKFVAERLLQDKSCCPEQEAKAWFESILLRKEVPGEVKDDWRSRFDSELSEWTHSRSMPASKPEFDWTKAGDVERGVARARELAHNKPSEAYRLVSRAVESGLPVAGLAVLELLEDRAVQWSEIERYLIEDGWREAILMKTFGCADPKDPRTW